MAMNGVYWRFSRAVWLAVGICFSAEATYGEAPDTLPTPSQLKKMSLEELMDVKVTLVSKRSEDLSRSPSPVQVITQDDIRRAGVYTLPDALRLFPNLQVARIDARQWAVTARGQNASLANKLLVMIDGRTVYTPLYAGVFWDVQSLLVDNIERIEVISGPGGTLWGANAVNGVINIVTKSSEHTHGGFVTAAEGTFMRHLLGWRYGDSVSTDWHYNIWARRLDHDGADSGAHAVGHNSWALLQGGFRADWVPAGADRVSVIGGVYGGDLDQPQPGMIAVDGQHLLARWMRAYEDGADFQAQIYFDRTFRELPGTFSEDLRTWDFDFQHHFALGARNSLTWGAGWRLMQDEIGNSPGLAVVPAHLDMQQANLFLQDEVTVVPDRLKLTVGSKLELTEYSGMEIMPSGRLAWTPDERHTLWGALSRAVRAPSRIDKDFYIPAPETSAPQRLSGGNDFGSEYVTAYESGWRHRILDNMTGSLSLFYNVYEELRILESIATDSTVFRFRNGAEGEVMGVELAMGWQAMSWWQLRGGATWMQQEFRLQPGHTEYPSPGNQGNDPEAIYLLQSMIDLPAGFEFNIWTRYVSELPAPAVPYYATLDASIFWYWRKLTVSVSGHDLAERRHAEFGSPLNRNQVPRSFSARIGARF